MASSWLAPLLLAAAAPLASAASTVLAASSGGLAVAINAQTGDYTVSVDGAVWLASASPDHLGRKVALLGAANSTGSDSQGAYSAITVQWKLAAAPAAAAAAAAPAAAVLETEFKAYSGRAEEKLALTQRWPAGVANTSAFYNSTTAAGVPMGRFPSFLVGNASHEGATPELNYFAFQGCQIQYTGFGRWASGAGGNRGPHYASGGAQQSMPLVLYDRSLRSIGISPLTNFFVAIHETATSGGSAFAAGVMASVASLPAGFEHTTVIVGGTSLNGTMGSLGASLLAESGKTPVDPESESYVLSHLGYWVDNGAPYYHTRAAYNISRGMEACTLSKNCTQEDALLAVQSDAEARKIPLRYFQWDDWAPLMWSWPPRAFQDGASHWLGADPHNASRPYPLSLYNGLWNGGQNVPFLQKYKWAGVKNAIPVDAEFFKAIFANGSKAGMVMMEQDYLCSSTVQTSADLTSGPAWFAAMDEALATAGESGGGIDVQLCMMNPAHALASTLIHRASNGRGTGDHVVRNAARGLPLGWSGMLLWAVGMWPSRDNVWTNSSVNVPGLNNESDPEGQTAMAVLAGGPYGMADIAGAMNRSLLMRSCRDDGVLLRADKPATAIEQTWVASFDDLKPRHVWGTFSQIGTARWSYVLALSLDDPLAVPMATLDESGAAAGWVAYEGWHGVETNSFVAIPHGGSLVIPSCPLVDAMTLGHSLWVVAPVLPFGWVFLGEEGKLVVASRRRVKGISASSATGGSSLVLTLVGAPGESVSVAVLAPTERHVATRVSCTAGDKGEAVAFGDIDVKMTVTCKAGSALTEAASCTCN